MSDKSRLEKIISGVLLLLIGTTVIILVTTEPTDKEIQENESLTLDLINRDIILIDHNNDFLTYGIPGEGTEENPYRIENYNITTTGTMIDIRDVTKFFVIRNCFLKGTSGIYIRNSPYVATIENNLIEATQYSINLFESGKSKIVNNTCNSGMDSIHLDNCAYSLVENNTCTFSGGEAIYVSYSIFTEITNNYCTTGSKGIVVENSDNSQIHNNTAVNFSSVGMHLDYCTNGVAIDNICNNNLLGMACTNSERATISNNICNNNDIEYGIYVDESPYSQIMENECNNNTWYCIVVHNSVFSNITRNSCYDNKFRMLIFTADCQVTYNHIENTADYGIEVLGDNNTIHHNNFIGNSMGLSPQALDDGLNNQWYDETTLEGNHWDDWIGIGSYSINGTAGAVDPYPLANPVDIIIIPEYGTISLLIILFTSSVIITFNIKEERRKNNFKV